MGVIKMRREFGFISRGYPYGTDVLYVYCDRCGSFDIGTYPCLRKWLLLIAAAAIMVGSTWLAIRPGSRFFWAPAIGLLICAVGIPHLWGDTDYRCRKCGNRRIIKNHPMDYASEIPRYNTRNYPADMSVVDVPDDRTQKRYQGYWDDEYQ